VAGLFVGPNEKQARSVKTKSVKPAIWPEERLLGALEDDFKWGTVFGVTANNKGNSEYKSNDLDFTKKLGFSFKRSHGNDLRVSALNLNPQKPTALTLAQPKLVYRNV